MTIIDWIKIVIHGVFLGFGIYNLIKDIMKIKSCTERVEAEIVGISRRRDGDGETLFSPVYSYKHDGSDYTGTSDLFTSSCSFDVGDRTELLVDPNYPARFRSPDETGSRFVFDFCLIIIGFISAVFLWRPYIMEIIHKIF